MLHYIIKKTISLKILGICEINSLRHRKCFVFAFFFSVKSPQSPVPRLFGQRFDTNNSWVKRMLPRAPYFLCCKLYVLDSVLYTMYFNVLAVMSFLFSFTGQEIPLEVTIEMLNGTKIVYQPDYNNLDSVLAKAFVNKFVAEVALCQWCCLLSNYYFIVIIFDD